MRAYKFTSRFIMIYKCELLFTNTKFHILFMLPTFIEMMIKECMSYELHQLNSLWGMLSLICICIQDEVIIFLGDQCTSVDSSLYCAIEKVVLISQITNICDCSLPKSF